LAKAKSSYVCQECAAVHTKWAGRCDSCGAWNALVEEAAPESAPKGLGGKRGKKIELRRPQRHRETPPPRRVAGIEEFDRVLGGGLVAGSAVLVGGDPGIGKSTLLMQVTARLAGQGKTVYISGEEAIAQLRLRARRLGLENAPVALAAATSVRDIISTLDTPDSVDVVVIDSIQTMYMDNLESAPGTVSQVRGSAQELDPPCQAARFRACCWSVT
jgi:DNA repair protein RadA/Sms